MNIVWLKRDLRLKDHDAFFNAVERPEGFCVLYIFEPSLMNGRDWDPRHGRFVLQCLEDLKSLQPKLPLYLLEGEAIDVFKTICKKTPVNRIFSHQEVGNAITYDRDRGLKKFFRSQNILWKEYPTGGIKRGAQDRKGWDSLWYQRARRKIKEISWKKATFTELPPEIQQAFDAEETLRPLRPVVPDFQAGGQRQAEELLQSFLLERHYDYFKSISKPELSRRTCSRLSPHLAYGTISTREVWQAIQWAKDNLDYDGRSLSAFAARLKWRCHFMQKFESQPSIEKTNINSAYDAIDRSHNAEIFRRWQDGLTGFPLIDASMRAVKATGYLNFRMRAMVVSFLTHHLWQDWREGSLFLAQQFLDYEPGIHYSQFQMQAGCTGTNTIRIYNPTKQVTDHDPRGDFIKKWIPELKKVPTSRIATPWELTPIEKKTIDLNYPPPLVDQKEAAKNARDKLWQVKNSKEARAEKKTILQKLSRPSRP